MTRPIRLRAFAAVVLLAAALGVAACGKKPGSLSPPEDAESIGYPRSYPAT